MLGVPTFAHGDLALRLSVGRHLIGGDALQVTESRTLNLGVHLGNLQTTRTNQDRLGDDKRFGVGAGASEAAEPRY